MLAGAAVIAGTMILTRGRLPGADPSPVYILVFLSAATITASVRSINGWPDKSEVYGLRKFFLWVFYIVSILVIAAGIVFVAFYVSLYQPLVFIIITAATITAWYLYDNYEPYETASEKLGIVSLWALFAASILVILACAAFIFITLIALFNNAGLPGKTLPLMILAAVGILGAGVSMKLLSPFSRRGKAGAARYVPITVALAITAVLCIFSISLFTVVMVTITLITTAAWFRSSGNKPGEPELTGRGKALLRAFQAVNILAILVGLTFIAIIWYITGYCISNIGNVLTLLVLAAAGIAAAALSLKLGPPFSAQGRERAVRCIPITLSVIITAVICFISLYYIPRC